MTKYPDQSRVLPIFSSHVTILIHPPRPTQITEIEHQLTPQQEVALFLCSKHSFLTDTLHLSDDLLELKQF